MPDSESWKYRDDFPEPEPSPPPGDAPEKPRPDEASRASAGSWVVMMIVFLCVVAGLATLADYAGQWKKELLVRGFVVEGVSSIAPGELLKRVADFKGQNLEALDLSQLKSRIVSYPYVSDAVIQKELNGMVRIRVVERVPVALTDIGGTTMVIDREGFLLSGKPEFIERMGKLMRVSGFTRFKPAGNGLLKMDRREASLLAEFLDAFWASEYASLLIREFHFSDNNQSYCIAAQTPTRFIVGNDGNFKEKLKKFEIFWQKVVSKKGLGSFETVDLRFRDRIFTRDSATPVAPQVNPPVTIRQE
ncbi:MAG: FtsQ-type POTRA domain-containing protein [Chlorobiaceae bacterium]